MPNPFVKLWKYLTASANAQIDQRADPKIQIAQAIEAEQQRHQALANQAAAVLGNQRQLEMRLNRQLGEVEKLQASARQALVLADKTRAGGDAAKAAEYENAAQAFATQLVAAEQSMEDLKRSHDEALQAAEQARGAVEQSRMRLQTTLAERTKLMSQLEQAKMQEHVAASLRQVNELSAPGNTPSLSEVRDKIEARYANALGQAELAQSSVEGRMLEVQKATLDVAGASRLDQIRASMSGGTRGGGGQPAPPRRSSRARRRCSSRRPSSARPSRPSGPTSRPDPRGPGAGAPVSGPGYPPPSYTGTAGEGARGCGAGDARPNCSWAGRRGALPGDRGETTGGAFGLYRWEMGPKPSGPGAALPPEHHRVVLRAERHGPAARRPRGGSTPGPGDFFHVPDRAASTASATSRGSRRRCCCCSRPGAPREDYFETLADAARARRWTRTDWTDVLPPPRHVLGATPASR